MRITRIPNWLVCEAIDWWLKEKDITPAELARKAGYLNGALIEKRIKNREALPTDFIRECVDILGLKTASRAKFEDTADILTDDECRERLTEPLRWKSSRRMHLQGKFWE